MQEFCFPRGTITDIRLKLAAALIQKIDLGKKREHDTYSILINYRIRNDLCNTFIILSEIVHTMTDNVHSVISLLITVEYVLALVLINIPTFLNWETITASVYISTFSTRSLGCLQTIHFANHVKKYYMK